MQGGTESGEFESLGDGLSQNLVAFPIEMFEIARAVQNVMHRARANDGTQIEEASALAHGSGSDHLAHLVAVLGDAFLGREILVLRSSEPSNETSDEIRL